MADNGKFKKGVPRHPNAGRKKGTPNKRTRSLEDLRALAEEKGCDPFEIYIEIAMDKNNRKVDTSVRLQAAKEIAKYVLPPTAQAIELSGPNGQPIQSEVEVSQELKEILADLQTIIDTKVNERKG